MVFSLPPTPIFSSYFSTKTDLEISKTPENFWHHGIFWSGCIKIVKNYQDWIVLINLWDWILNWFESVLFYLPQLIWLHVCLWTSIKPHRFTPAEDLTREIMESYPKQTELLSWIGLQGKIIANSMTPTVFTAAASHSVQRKIFTFNWWIKSFPSSFNTQKIRGAEVYT